MAKRNLDIPDLPSNNINDGTDEIARPSKIRKKSSVGVAADIKDIARYLYEDVILPNLKSGITDFVTNGIEMIIWGADGRTGRRGSGARRITNYNERSRVRRSQPRYQSRERRLNIDEMYFDTRQEAENVLRGLLEALAEYEWVTVLDLHSLVGITSDHNNQRWGWSDLSRVRIVYTRHGYLLDLPEPEYSQ